VPAGKPDVSLAPSWVPTKPRVYRWNESVLDLHLDIDLSGFPVGESIRRAGLLAKSRAFLSALAAKVAGQITPEVFKEIIGRISPSNEKELLVAEQARRQTAQQVRSARFVSGRPAQLACNQ